MKTSQLKTISIIILFVLLLSACGKTSEPELTATPAPTSTPVPPTATPVPEDILAEAWQAYENNDLDTALEIAKQVRDQNREIGAESGDSYALIGLIEAAENKDNSALLRFEKAYTLGYENAEIQESLIGFFQAAIEDLNNENHSTYSPLTIKPNIDYLRGYLERLEELDPLNPTLERYSDWLHPQVFNPENYTEEELSADEITNLLEGVYRWITFSEGNTYFSELHEKYPDNPITMVMLATYEFYNENYLDALELYTAAVGIEPGILQAWEFMGYSFEEIGAMEHAREAYIHCLLLDKNNRDADYRLKELSGDLRWWPKDFFEDYGFGMYYNGTATLSILGDTATNQAGVAQSEDDLIFFQLTWQTETGAELNDEHLQAMMVSTMDANTPRFKSEFLTFDYGEVPMIYRNFTYKIIGSQDWADGVIIGWYSEGITFILELCLVEDGYDHEYLNWLMATYIETFTADPLLDTNS
ncbi:MAG: hypothetical protein ABFS17_00860 [Chloroflexota bacterium]